jgi:hypothetical protein
MEQVVSKYEVQPVDGVYNYGPAHTQRQADAQAALDELSDLDASVVLRIMDSRDAVATVYKTRQSDESRHVIWLRPSRKITPDLHQLNEQLGREGAARIHHTGQATVDPLHAPDVRDLEVSTRRGVVRLDRSKVQQLVDAGQTSVTLDDVRHGD